MACPCKKEVKTCNCESTGDCKCGDSCACENCAGKQKKEEKHACACAASGKACECGENCKC